MSSIGELIGGSTTTTIWLRGLVGVWLIWVIGLPLGLISLIFGTVAGKSWYVIKGARGRVSYFLISSLYI